MFFKSIHNDKFLKSRSRMSFFLVIVFILSVTTAYAAPLDSEVIILDGDNLLTVYTEHSTVDKIISQHGIEVADSDLLYPRANSEITQNENLIVIKRLKKVDVTLGGESVTYWTDAETYREFVSGKNLPFNENDGYSVNLDAELTADENVVTVTKITHEQIEEIVSVPYKSSTVKDSNLEKGKKIVKTPGKKGSKKIIYNVEYHDGIEVARTVAGEETVAAPVDEVVRVGTKAVQYKTAAVYGSTTAPTSYKKLITCSATAYDLSFESCGKRPGDPGYGITASGTMAKIGTVAVDPRVIPLGTKMYIVSTDGKYVYGYCTAEDVGGGIKGNKVDLFFNTRNECLQFGRRQVNVYIL